MKAISKHEEFLMIKSFKAFRVVSKKRNDLEIKKRYIELMVSKNMLQFYFKRMLKKYAEINLSKNLRKVARSHHLSVSK